jgi:hypothetical protein
VSRHVLRDDDVAQVVVGWDPPLHTYFAQVFDVAAFKKELERDPDADVVLVLWEGLSPDAITSLDRLAVLVGQWALLDVDTRRLLEEERAANV